MIAIQLAGNAPIYEQLITEIEKLILRGVLFKDDMLPSVREMACELAVNPNTVQRAYGLLEERGVTYSVPGKGRFVAVSKEELLKRRESGNLALLKQAVMAVKASGVSKEEAGRILNEVYGEAEGGEKA